jgi:hypothetical protein
MTHVYFHCSNAERFVSDPRGTDVEDLIEAHRRAADVVREFAGRLGPQDYRTWALHLSDGDGNELFLMPFWCVVGRPH